MRMPPDRLADVVHYCALTWPGASILSLTSAATGLPALGELDLAVLPRLVSLRYDAVPGLAPHGLPLPTEDEQLGWAGQASFDVVMLDPFHTLDSSRAGVRAALAAARPASVVLVHDCLPPPELRAAEYRPGAWCGVTHEALLDVVLDGDRDWCTIDADFGIAVVGPAGSRVEPTPVEADLQRRWRDAGTGDERAAVFAAHGPALVRAVTPAEGQVALDRFVDLAAGPAGADDRLLRRRIARLEADVADAADRLAVVERQRDDEAAGRREAEAALAAALADRAEAAARADAAVDALSALRASPTFRLGRGLTSPARVWRQRPRGQ